MKKLKYLFCVLFLLTLFSLSALANNVSHIDINVVVLKNGDAEITQVWKGSFEDSTENYIVIGNLDGMTVKDFSVSDEYGAYETDLSWNINASRLQKKNKCGIIIRDDGTYELCWGIGDYGERRYTVSYTITDFIASYTDLDGSNFMFVNPEMSTFPTLVTFNLSLEDGTPISDMNSNVWGFGFNGEVGFHNGFITANTSSALEGDNYFVIMFSLEKGIVNSDRTYDYTFDKVREKAFEGSDYSSPDDDMWMVWCVVGVFGAVGAICIAHAVAIRRERKKFTKEAPYFRDTPNNKNLPLSYYLCQKFGVGGNEGSIIGAAILKMIDDGNIQCYTVRTQGFFGRDRDIQQISLIKEPQDEYLSRLYSIMTSAAGEDGVLQEKELEKYASTNYKSLRSYLDFVKNQGEDAFCAEKGFTAGISNRIKALSETGKSELSQIIGLKKYLQEFSLIDEREVSEIEIWQEYLVYATLFGIADKVLEQLKEVYPDSIPQIQEYSRNVNMSGIYYASMYRSMVTAEQRARSSGSGGRASFGGGGGFSGGGRGGGSR